MATASIEKKGKNIAQTVKIVRLLLMAEKMAKNNVQTNKKIISNRF